MVLAKHIPRQNEYIAEPVGTLELTIGRRGEKLPLSFFITDDLFIVWQGGLSKNYNAWP